MHVVEFGAASAAADSAQLRSELADIILRLRWYAEALKLKSESPSLFDVLGGLVFPPVLGLSLYWTTTGPAVTGWDTMFGIISAKERSIDDVVAGTLSLEKWMIGVEAFRKGLADFAAYVDVQGETWPGLKQLALDMLDTLRRYAPAVAAGLGLAAAALIALAVLVRR